MKESASPQACFHCVIAGVLKRALGFLRRSSARRPEQLAIPILQPESPRQTDVLGHTPFGAGAEAAMLVRWLRPLALLTMLRHR